MTDAIERAHLLLNVIKKAVAHPKLNGIKEQAMMELEAMDAEAAEQVAERKAELKAKADEIEAERKAEEAERLEAEAKAKAEEDARNAESQVVQKPQLTPVPQDRVEPLAPPPEPEVERRV